MLLSLCLTGGRRLLSFFRGEKKKNNAEKQKAGHCPAHSDAPGGPAVPAPGPGAGERVKEKRPSPPAWPLFKKTFTPIRVNAPPMGGEVHYGHLPCKGAYEVGGPGGRLRVQGRGGGCEEAGYARTACSARLNS